MIRVVICDGDGTLELPNPSEEVRNLIDTIDELGITLAVASNAQNRKIIENRFQVAGLKLPEIVVTRSEVDSSKPSPVYVDAIQEIAGVDKSEIVYLGDDDRTDMYCAINSGILPYAAHYSGASTPLEYGIPVISPKSFQDFLSSFGMQEPPYFGWTFDSTCDDTGSPVAVRVLLGQHGGHTNDLKTVLKDKGDVLVGTNNNSLKSLLFHYLISQCYLSGITSNIDCWAVYPGHAKGSENDLLSDFCNTAALVFRDSPVKDLIIRHTDAPESKTLQRRDIYDQFRTVLINPDQREKITDKNILVLDDFSTSGNSLETARRLLLEAGVREVVSVAFAKYRTDHVITRISENWDPYQPTTLSDADVISNSVTGNFNLNSDRYFWEEILPIYSN